MDRGEERCAMLTQVLQDRRQPRPSSSGFCRERRPQPRQVIGEVQRDAAVAFAERLDADPDDFAGAHQRVEHPRCVVVYARRQDFALEDGRRDGGALQLLDRIEQRLEPASTRADAVPRHEKAAERFGIDRLDLVAQPCKRSPAKAAQHVGIDPLAFGAARPEFALDQLAGGGELQERAPVATPTPRP